MRLCIHGNAPPEQGQYAQITVLDIDTGATELENLVAPAFIRREIKFTCAVITQAACCCSARLQAISAYEITVAIVP